MKWLMLLIPLLIGTLAWSFDLVRVKGTSMEPSLCDGEVVATLERWLPTESTSSLRNEIVVLEQPAGELLVKRVVAIAGDRIRIEHGHLIRNGERVKETYTCGGDYFDTWPYGALQSVKRTFTVPVGEVFVMGDNRDASIDSRVFGSIPLKAFRGVVEAKLPLQDPGKCSCRAHRLVPKAEQ
jgi:signal peptidase I